MIEMWCLQVDHAWGRSAPDWRTISVDDEAEIAGQLARFTEARPEGAYRAMPYGDTAMPIRHGNDVWREPRRVH